MPPKNWAEEKGFRKRLQFLCSVDSRDLIPTPGNDIFFYLFQFIYKIILWPYTIIYVILTDVSSIVCNSMIYSTYRYGTIIYFLDYCVSFKNVLYFKEKRLWESYKKVFSKWGSISFGPVPMWNRTMLDIFAMRGDKLEEKNHDFIISSATVGR